MSAALSPEPDEPAGSGLPGDGREDGEEGIPQGLYVTAPAEDLSLEGFAADGRADTMAPGPLLAMVLDAVAGPDGAGLAGLADDQLTGFLSGARRVESRLAWAAGKLGPVHVKIIEEFTSVLSGADGAIADELLAAAAQSKTYGELRRAASRLVLRLDPEAARKRKEKARREARVRAFREESGNAGIDLLQERDSRPVPGESSASDRTPGPGGPSIGAQVTITVPATALDGDTGLGAEVDGFGIVDHADTRELIVAAARNPATRWCLTTVNPDGTAAAHACATGPRPWGTAHGPPGQEPGSTTLQGLLDLLNITQLTPVARGPCGHAQAEDRYRPSRKLTHLVRARNTTCTAPGCGRRAARCDLDHTHPHHDGGLTCECNLAPLCRHHHRLKQADGWQLEQPQPGVLVWHTPAGRTYTTTPTQYAT